MAGVGFVDTVNGQETNSIDSKLNGLLINFRVLLNCCYGTHRCDEPLLCKSWATASNRRSPDRAAAYTSIVGCLGCHTRLMLAGTTGRNCRGVQQSLHDCNEIILRLTNKLQGMGLASTTPHTCRQNPRSNWRALISRKKCIKCTVLEYQIRDKVQMFASREVRVQQNCHFGMTCSRNLDMLIGMAQQECAPPPNRRLLCITCQIDES